MASNNEKEENVDGKIFHEEKVPEGSGSAIVAKEEKVVEAKDLVESKPVEKKQEDVTGDTEDKDKATIPSKEEVENPEVEVYIPNAPEGVPSEQPSKPADVTPLQTQQKGCCVIL